MNFLKNCYSYAYNVFFCTSVNRNSVTSHCLCHFWADNVIATHRVRTSRLECVHEDRLRQLVRLKVPTAPQTETNQYAHPCVVTRKLCVAKLCLHGCSVLGRRPAAPLNYVSGNQPVASWCLIVGTACSELRCGNYSAVSSANSPCSSRPDNWWC